MTRNSKPDRAAVRHLRLDAVGGVAGDMFVAAFVDVWPTLEPVCRAAISAMEPPAGTTAVWTAHGDGTLNGTRFVVSEEAAAASNVHAHRHSQTQDKTQDRTQPGRHKHSHAHKHTHWSDIRARLEAAPLDADVRRTAIAIFHLLAEAEAKVHGIDVDAVAFHEVGAWDSIIDILAAAAIICEFGQCTWSMGPLPSGRGLVSSAHGMLPVPAPATIELLRGFDLIDDGEDGERVTPTGAAIIKYLGPNQEADRTPRRLLDSGLGFGTRRLQRRSNVLRVSAYGEAASQGTEAGEVVEVLRCEIDDQSPEDLAIGLDHLREEEGVIDVCQWQVQAKKGRAAAAVQVLVRPAAADRVAARLFEETTTLGIRHSTSRRSVLDREMVVADEGMRVKVARRGTGATAKAESDDVSRLRTEAERRTARQRAEQAALKGAGRRDEH